MSFSISRNTLLALAGAAALAVVLCALFLPWHDIISGDEQLAPERMPQTRQTVAQAKADFDQANTRYQDYIKTHDLSALHDQILSTVGSLAASGSQSANGEVAPLASQVKDYAAVLQEYARASDAYLRSLQSYDDDLMSWTRGLFGASESLRSQTWPFVEHIKLYPEPVGLKADPPMVHAGDVESQINSLQSHLAALQAVAGNSNSVAAQEALNGIKNDVNAIWESGRSVEYIAGLHAEYRDDLATYDTKVIQAAQDPQAATPVVVSPALAWGLTLIVTVLTLGGLTALFVPRLRTETAA